MVSILWTVYYIFTRGWSCKSSAAFPYSTILCTYFWTPHIYWILCTGAITHHIVKNDLGFRNFPIRAGSLSLCQPASFQTIWRSVLSIYLAGCMKSEPPIQNRIWESIYKKDHCVLCVEGEIRAARLPNLRRAPNINSLLRSPWGLRI